MTNLKTTDPELKGIKAISCFDVRPGSAVCVRKNTKTENDFTQNNKAH